MPYFLISITIYYLLYVYYYLTKILGILLSGFVTFCGILVIIRVLGCNRRLVIGSGCIEGVLCSCASGWILCGRAEVFIRGCCGFIGSLSKNGGLNVWGIGSSSDHPSVTSSSYSTYFNLSNY